MEKPALPFKIASVFLLINAAFWLIFAGVTAIGTHPSYPTGSSLRWGMVIIGIAVSAVLVWFYTLLTRRSHSGYYLTIAGLITTALIVSLDQVGPIDLLVMLAAIIPAILLLVCRRWYFS